MTQQFHRRKLFSDPTPNAILNNRILQGMLNVALQTSLTDGEQSEFLNLLLLVVRKMVSVWNHKERYQKEEVRLIEKVKNPLPTDPDVEMSQELLAEYDEFLVQIKSVLDHVVKIGQPVLGKNAWNLQTFGDKGEDVLKALKNNAPRKYNQLVDGFEKKVFDKHRPWLQSAIAARDQVNHCLGGGIAAEAFTVAKLGDEVRVPMVSVGLSVSGGMENLWLNLIQLVEDLTALFLNYRLVPPLILFHGSIPPNSPQSAYVVTTEAAIAARFGQGVWQKIT